MVRRIMLYTWRLRIRIIIKRYQKFYILVFLSYSRSFKLNAFGLNLEGVYATRTWIDNEWLDSVSFLGHRVTTDDSFAVETHILDKEIGAVKGKIHLAFVDFIRSNQKFDSLEALKQQITDDILRAKEILA